MDLSIVLILYFIVLICLIFIFYKSSIKLISSIILSLIISFILLNILKPPPEINLETENLTLYFIYISIQFFTPIMVFIYAIMVSLSDKNNRVCKIVTNKHLFDFVE